jgi:ribA/ribD-fused uncharacterized protein
VTKANNPVDHPQHVDDLRQRIRAGWQPEFVFFLSPDDVVLRGSIAKFQQHPQLQEYLLKTGDCALAEASPVDNIWGIGFEAADARAKDPTLWTGLNLLGFTLMQVREHFCHADAANAQ